MAYVHRGFLSYHAVEALIQPVFRKSVKRRGRLIQHHYRSILVQRPRKSQLLFLAAREVNSVVVQDF